MALELHSPPPADPAHVTATAHALIASLLAGRTQPGGTAAFPKPLNRPQRPAGPEDGPATASVSGSDRGSP